MKTLVIHPSDPTTAFLKIIYENEPWTVVDQTCGKDELKELIKNHDRIIMMGHGTTYGLLSSMSNKNINFIIDPSLVYLLKEKKCFYIWCDADYFVTKYKLKGFFTGMIISESSEAEFYKIEATKNEIDQSNIMFAQSIKKSIDSKNIAQDISKTYSSNTNPVIIFNAQRLYFSE